MTRSTHHHRAALLATALAASAGAQCARDSSPGSCVSVACSPRPSAGPRYPAAVMPDCDAMRASPAAGPSASARPDAWWPLAIGRTHDARQGGQPEVCCYEGPGMCGVGRPLRVGGRGRAAPLARRGWG